MVRIIDGEIVQDDDPDSLSRSHTARPATQQQGPGRPGPQAAAGSGGGGLVPAGFSSGFDWSAPAFKTVPRADAAGGLPDVELYGLRVPGVGLVGVAAAGAMFGLKGLLAAAVLGYLYLRTSGAGAQAAGAGTAAARTPAGQRSGGMFQMQQRQQGQDEGGFMGATPQPRPGQGPAGQGSTAFKGKAYKLGGR